MSVCHVFDDGPKRQEEAMTPGDNPLAIFDKCHVLFYVPTGTQDPELSVPSEGSCWLIGAQSIE